MRQLERATSAYPNTSSRACAQAVGNESNNMPSIRDFVHGMTDHFRLRATGWIMSLTTMLYGFVLLSNPQAFEIASRPYQYVYLLRIAPQLTWAYFCLALGALRFIALVINGTFPTFVWSPHTRAITSFVTVFIWFQILFGAFHESTLNLALPSYLTFFLLDVFNVYIATLEIERDEK